MLDVAQFRKYAVRPVLKFLDPDIPYSMAAENLLIGTAVHESRLTYLHQIGGGPARGLFQMEPATEQDIWNNYLQYRNDLSSLIEAMRNFRSLDLTTNLAYQVAMARVHYWRSPCPLPAEDDIQGMASIWKQVYNTPLGAGTVEQFIAHYPDGE